MAQKQKNQGCLGGLLNATVGLLSLLFKLLLNLIGLTYDILFAGFKFSQIQNKSGFVLFWTTAATFCLIGGLLATGARSGINGSNATPVVATVEVTRLAQVEVTRLVERVVTVTPTHTPEFTPTITPTPTITSTPTRTPRFTQTPAKTPTPLAQYISLLGKIWAGVKIYYGTGSEKAYGFEILGGSENCPSLPSGRGVKVRYPDSTEEWKDREYLVSSGLFFVLENDPAIPKLEWYVYSFCP